MTERRRLDSWKAIASHLGRNVRTVIRWERERALPVHRVPGGRTGSVFAYTDELDAWLSGRAGALIPKDDDRALVARHRWPILTGLAAAAALAVVMAGVHGLRWWTTPLRIDSIAIDGDALVASTRQGEPLWRYVSDPSQFDLRRGRIWHAVHDLDQQPGDEVVVAGTSAFEEPEALLSFSNRGGLRWRRSFEDTFTFGQRRFGPPWRTSDLVVTGPESRIAWALHHHSWFPSVIASYSADGRLLDRFVHPGWITSLRASRDGRYLLGAGVNNDLDARVLVVIDPARPRGTAKPAGTTSLCADCPVGDPVRYIVFPRTELSRLNALPLLNNRGVPKVVVLPSGRILVHVAEHPPDGPMVESVYEIGPDLSILGGRAGDSYWDWHRQLEVSGHLDHAAVNCPDRHGLPIREGSA